MTRPQHFEPNYYTISETIWQRCQGRMTIFSPLDWAYLAAWEDHEIPVEAIILGIVRTFQNLRPESHRPIHIHYCAAEIYRAAEQLQEDALAGHGRLRAAVRRQWLGESC